MRTVEARIEDLYHTGMTDCKGFTPEECLAIVKKANEILVGNYAYCGKINKIYREQKKGDDLIG